MTQTLSDEELDAIMSAAWALHPAQRAAFEQAVLAELQKLLPATLGPGSVHRTVAMVQRAFLGTGIGGTGNLAKYGRAGLRAKGR